MGDQISGLSNYDLAIGTSLEVPEDRGVLRRVLDDELHLIPLLNVEAQLRVD